MQTVYNYKNNFQEDQYFQALKKLTSRNNRLRLSVEDEEIIKKIANKL